MAKPKDPARTTPPRGAPQQTQQPRKQGQADSAFDVWLRRNLHDLYDPITEEPIPEALLKLINQDRGK